MILDTTFIRHTCPYCEDMISTTFYDQCADIKICPKCGKMFVAEIVITEEIVVWKLKEVKVEVKE